MSRFGSHCKRCRCFRENISSPDVKAGMVAAKKRGSKIGRPRAAVDLDVAMKMKGEGKSVRDIAKALGVGVGTVQRALQGVPKGSPDPASGRDRQPLGLQGHGKAA